MEFPEMYAHLVKLDEHLCTGQLKTHLISKEVNRLKGELGALHYLGVAEALALQVFYDRGFDFSGLYEVYHRASCWCCTFQCIDKLRKYHAERWAKLPLYPEQPDVQQ